MVFKIKKSMQLFEKALKLIPAGASSNARLWPSLCKGYAPCSLYAQKAKNSHLWDVDGNKYVDYRLGFGPVILGHSYDKVDLAVHKALGKGTVFALDNILELKVAKLIKKMVPCAEMTRFSNTGTEATMHAIRIARAFTNKDKIIKFEGHYHGAHDYVLWSTEPSFETPLKKFDQKRVQASLGIPKKIKDLVLVERFNNFTAIEKLVKKYKNEVAAIILEPVMGNAGVIPPKRGYLRWLRQLCDENNIVLIFDEVKTGFRMSKGGAQEFYGVKPDIATFSKSLGNGYPVAAISGKREIMEIVGPKKVVHGGTFASNPISLSAAYATLRILNKGKVYKHLENYGRALREGIADIFHRHKLDFVIQGTSAMFQFLFTKLEEINEYRDLSSCDFNMFEKIQYELLKNGVLIDADNEEPMFTCYSHSKNDLDKTLIAFRNAVHTVLKLRGKHPGSKKKKWKYRGY